LPFIDSQAVDAATPSIQGVNSFTSANYINAAHFSCPNMASGTSGGCTFNLGIVGPGANDGQTISVGFHNGGSTAANYGFLSVGTTGAFNPALKWDYTQHVYLPGMLSIGCLGTDSSGLLGSGTGCGGTGSGTVSGQAANVIGIATGATTTGAQSHIDEATAGTTTVSQKLAVNDGTGGSGVGYTEGTPKSGSAGVDLLTGDSTTHQLLKNPNNTGTKVLVGASTTAATSGHCAQFAANGYDIADAGAACGSGGGVTGMVTISNTGSDWGAQCNAALTTLGAGGGIIYTAPGTYTQSTTCTINQLNIQLLGAGPQASIVNCTFNGDCLALSPPLFTNSRASAGTVANMAFIGNAGASQTPVHTRDMIGWTLHDLLIDGSTSPTAPATGTSCLMMENVTAWTERNVTYNIQFGNHCYIPVNMKHDAGDSFQPGSFGYNEFSFAMEPTDYGVYMQGNAVLYNGSLHLIANMQGGKLIHMQDTFSTQFTQTPDNITEKLNVNVENQTGGGQLFDLTTTKVALFEGWINNSNSFGSLVPQGTAFSQTFYLAPPGLTTTYLTSTSYTNTFGALTGSNTANGTFNLSLSGLCANITGTNTCLGLMGKAASTNNSMTWGWNPSTTRGFLGVYGGSANGVEWDSSGHVFLPAVATSASTAPVCPNGTGGALTTTGCSLIANALTMNNSGSGAASGSTFDGSAAKTISYNTIGAAPTASPTFTGTVTLPAPTLNNVTGSTQCLHVNSSGVISGTGSDCGTGSGGNFINITSGITISGGSGSTSGGVYTTTATATAITLTSIPSTYLHLKIIIYGANTGAGASVNCQFNTDTGSHYAEQQMFANAASASAGSVLLGTTAPCAVVGGSSNIGFSTIEIPFYSSSLATHAMKWQGSAPLGALSGNNMYEIDGSFWWQPSAPAAINAITFNTGNTAFASGLLISVYGEN
jgi:hypothetical protein